MKYNPETHHRKSIRLKYYDYSTEGMYFITICTQNRKHILSKIKHGDCRGRVPPLPSGGREVRPYKKNLLF